MPVVDLYSTNVRSRDYRAGLRAEIQQQGLRTAVGGLSDLSRVLFAYDQLKKQDADRDLSRITVAANAVGGFNRLPQAALEKFEGLLEVPLPRDKVGNITIPQTLEQATQEKLRLKLESGEDVNKILGLEQPAPSKEALDSAQQIADLNNEARALEGELNRVNRLEAAAIRAEGGADEPSGFYQDMATGKVLSAEEAMAGVNAGAPEANFRPLNRKMFDSLKKAETGQINQALTEVTMGVRALQAEKLEREAKDAFTSGPLRALVPMLAVFDRVKNEEAKAQIEKAIKDTLIKAGYPPEVIEPWYRRLFGSVFKRAERHRFIREIESASITGAAAPANKRSQTEAFFKIDQLLREDPSLDLNALKLSNPKYASDIDAYIQMRSRAGGQ